MSEAFLALDEYFWGVAHDPDLYSPDEAHDWICMMHSDDWSALGRAWDDRPAPWREECAYILGQGPVFPSLEILARALFDSDPSVAGQAAISYSAQLLGCQPIPPLAPELRSRLQELASEDPEGIEIRELLQAAESE